jgi:hypothetical protein
LNNSLQTGHVLRIPVKPGPWRITACVPAFRFGFMSVCGTAASTGRFLHRGTRESQESPASLFAVRYPRTCKRTTDDTPHHAPWQQHGGCTESPPAPFPGNLCDWSGAVQAFASIVLPQVLPGDRKAPRFELPAPQPRLKCSGPASPGISSAFFLQDSPFDTTRMKQWPRTGFPV